jgi:hypothetical protein
MAEKIPIRHGPGMAQGGGIETLVEGYEPAPVFAAISIDLGDGGVDGRFVSGRCGKPYS